MFGRTRHRRTLSFATTEYGHVALDEVNGRYWHLNDSALVVCRCLTDGRGQEAAVRELVETYEIDEATARRDVEATSSQLRKVGLL
ncbi:lasso peptide biosynthesis PqqD family chaperone [Desertihabitans aurantiacus]|uniref:lasso peptide biosynthesis PqqD family chaperone n=1 Tax=Desertihabitans aurantiacus TaxID=2282477 RepID=UPI000DF7454C|nr:lasso peptide biosynthesis PqqD family chaperone [Desertihabitans aurantiacus]